MKLEDAIALAAAAHRRQTDKAGEPYILHPLRVMFKLKGKQAMMAGVLHDVVEDTDVTLDEMRRRGCPKAVVEAVDLLTRRDGESYGAFIERLSRNPLAVQVKLADLEDNMDLRRLREFDARDAERMRKYLSTWQQLLDVMEGKGKDRR